MSHDTQGWRGEGWWGERWLTWVAALGIGPESEGQRRSALRAEGRLQVEKGGLTAQVWVGDRRQVTAILKVRPWTDREWRKAVGLIASEPSLAQRVLSGTMGAELETALVRAGLALFPGEATIGCQCTTGNAHCRHLNYLVLQAARELELNPFFWLEAIGRSRQDLLAAVKDRLAGEGGARTGKAAGANAAGGEPSPLNLAHFWKGVVDPETVLIRPSDSSASDRLIRTLGPLEVGEELYLLPKRTPLQAEEWIRRMVAQVGQTASSLALGRRGRGPARWELPFKAADLPGKAVSLAARLAPEMAAVVREEGAMLSLSELFERCPTAFALGNEEMACRVLHDAADRLPPDLVRVADYYVGSADALLDGAHFCHVVTFDEWVNGEADGDADWVRAFATAGRKAPSLAGHFRRLKPEVGDELHISLYEGELEVDLVRRDHRNLAARLRSDGIASRTLQQLVGILEVDDLPEADAVAALLVQGGYRGGMHPDPLWLLPLLGPGLYLDPADRSLSRLPNRWRPDRPRFVYGVWREREQALADFQAPMLKRWAPMREVEGAVRCVRWWNQVWPGPQDTPAVAESLGRFLHFLWNLAPRDAKRYGIPPQDVPAIMERWFGFLEERYPAVAGAFQRHRLACRLREQYVERCRTAPVGRVGEGAVQTWEAEGYRWIGPRHYIAGGGYL